MSVGNGSSIESEKYHIIRELGRGGMGVVYLAEDRQLRRQVALKVLYDYLNRDRAFVERFQEEACSVSTLHHPNIVCVHGLERAGETVAIDMELVEGVSLDQLRNTSPHVGAAIARDVLGGLSACHQIGVIHRDIKPSNILLNRAGQAKITDFGLATAYASHMETTLQGGSSSGFYMGTPRYMPMQAWEGRNPEPIWDLYSFGVVLHELISGKPAFKGENPVAVMRKQLMEPLPPLHTVCTHVSPEFSQLVDALLNSCREGGEIACADAFDLLRNTPELKALQESDTASTLPIKGLVRRKRKEPRGGKRPLPALAGAVALIAITGAVLYSFRPESTSREPNPPPAAMPATPPAATIRSGALFYDAQEVGAEVRYFWMVNTDSEGRPARITGISNREFWVLDVNDASAAGNLSVRGHWAARISSDSAATEYGTLAGTLLWEPGRDQPVLTLSRKRGNDHAERPQTFAADRKDGVFDRATFYRMLEGNDVLMSLLYTELLTRNLDWAIALEGQLPALQGARMTVPQIAEVIAVDGKAGEPTWVQGAFDEYGPIGKLNAADAALMARWDDSAAYLCATCPIPGAAFEIGVGPGAERLPSESGRYIVKVAPDGTVDGKYFQGNRQRPWACDWKIAIATDGGGTRVEIELPASTFVGSARPEPGRRWRVNACFKSPGVDTSHAAWGAAAVQEVEHGALLVFQASESSR